MGVSSETVDAVQRFHGHMCPGLAIGIRVAEVALREIGAHARDEEVVAIVDTDMCAVDAIQYLTGCTFGKGNLIHTDYGKSAFTFLRRSDGKAIRVVTKPGAMPPSAEHRQLFQKVQQRTATPHEERRFRQLHDERSRYVLEAAESDLFAIKPVTMQMPRPARIHESIPCAQCGEQVMETRIRRFSGQNLCIPCFEHMVARW